MSDPRVETFFAQAETWAPELRALRALLLETGMEEAYKWSKPAYTVEGRNVVILVPFKHYVSLLFAKGALLKDPQGLLVKAGEQTQAARQMRFTGRAQIKAQEREIRRFLREAVQAEKEGRDVEYKPITEYAVPAELQAALNRDSALKAAFTALTPGRKRGYFIFIGGAKQAATREARVRKCAPRILAGKGLNDD